MFPAAAYHGGTRMILIVDCSSLGNPDVSCYDRLIRNADGEWIHGFAGNIRFSNILHAQLLAVYYGFVMAWEFSFLELWCYSDSKTVIKLISKPVNNWHHYAAILHNIRDLIDRDRHINLLHTVREKNVSADYFAKSGAQSLEAYTPIVVPPV